MKRMDGSSTAAENKSAAVALGRDMLKRPSQLHTTSASSAGGGEGSMGTSVSMSAFSYSKASSSSSSPATSSSRRPPRNKELKKPTLTDSFASLLQNNPKEEVEKLTNCIMEAVAKCSDNKSSNYKTNNETFAPMPTQTQQQPQGQRFAGQRRRRTTNRRRSNSINNADINMNWMGFYKPVSSRRNSSREGGELVASMKLNAAKLLAELGNISDDSEDEDDDLLQLDVLETCGDVMEKLQMDGGGISYEPVKFG
mmetsp:Transcript_498/g.974  ORF Transcript_498/g.974 Transcript_498/m.974 type:complete len:254 (+) Transcript_498:184-945(+)